MIKNISISLLPSEAADHTSIKRHIAGETGINSKRITGYHIQRQSIDARGKQPRYILLLQVFIDEKVVEQVPFNPQLQDVSHAPPYSNSWCGACRLIRCTPAYYVGV